MKLITTILNKKFDLCLFNYLLNIPTRFVKIRPMSIVGTSLNANLHTSILE
jgi:hypothetical protein